MSKKILIAEDEKPMANALELKLNNSGFEATAVADGQQVMDALEKQSFNLLLLDLVMPKMDGFQVLEAIQAKKIKMPIIVASNLSQTEDIERAKKLGAKDYFIKSNTSIAQVVEQVKKILGS